MEIIFNGSDRMFELLNWRYDPQAPFHPCLYKHHEPSLSLSLSLSLYIYIYIYIYIEMLKYNPSHQISVRRAPNLEFQSSNDRSEPFNLFFILISPCRPNFTFFSNFFVILSDRSKINKIDTSEIVGLVHLWPIR